MEVEMEQTNQLRANHRSKSLVEDLQLEDLRVSVHAGKASKRALQQANDHFRRANRDLGELAAFIAASLTTVTAVEAVINIAVVQIHLSIEILRVAFDVYIAVFLIIFLWGAFRAQRALRRR